MFNFEEQIDAFRPPVNVSYVKQDDNSGLQIVLFANVIIGHKMTFGYWKCLLTVQVLRQWYSDVILVGASVNCKAGIGNHFFPGGGVREWSVKFRSQ